jgi:hypothetical protein
MVLANTRLNLKILGMGWFGLSKCSRTTRRSSQHKRVIRRSLLVMMTSINLAIGPVHCEMKE